MKFKNLYIDNRKILYNKKNIVLYSYKADDIGILYKTTATISKFRREKHDEEKLIEYYLKCRKLKKIPFRILFYSYYDKTNCFPFFRFFLENELIEVYKSKIPKNQYGVWILLRNKKTNKINFYKYIHSISIN